MRLVLDTNIWLDWLVFDDPGVAPLRAAHAAGRAQIYIDGPCEDELRRVLAYSLRKRVLEESAQTAALATCRQIATHPQPDQAAAKLPLPKCGDPDDQKFLELARAARADVLITKDRALLELARRKYAWPGFRILTLKAFNQHLAESGPA